MKKEISTRPAALTEAWPGELSVFSWQDFVTAIPTPLFLATTYKSNGKENACLQSWSSFLGSGGEFVCLLGAVSKSGHFYKSLKETGCCVLNFPSKDIHEKCVKTIENNGFDDDEITLSGLTAEQAASVNAPRIAECFLNVECEFLWEHDCTEGGPNAVVALKATHICMDDTRYDDAKLGRYGKTGYLYNVNSPRNPDTGAMSPEGVAVLELLK